MVYALIGDKHDCTPMDSNLFWVSDFPMIMVIAMVAVCLSKPYSSPIRSPSNMMCLPMVGCSCSLWWSKYRCILVSCWRNSAVLCVSEPGVFVGEVASM